MITFFDLHVKGILSLDGDTTILNNLVIVDGGIECNEFTLTVFGSTKFITTGCVQIGGLIYTPNSKSE